MTDRHEKAADEGGSIKVGDHARILRRGDTWWINIQVHRRQVRRSLETTNKSEATKRALKIERGMVEGNLNLDRDKITLDEAIRAYDAFLVHEGRAKRTLTQYRHTFKLMRQIAAELGRPLRLAVHSPPPLEGLAQIQHTQDGPGAMTAPPPPADLAQIQHTSAGSSTVELQKDLKARYV